MCYGKSNKWVDRNTVVKMSYTRIYINTVFISFSSVLERISNTDLRISSNLLFYCVTNSANACPRLDFSSESYSSEFKNNRDDMISLD